MKKCVLFCLCLFGFFNSMSFAQEPQKPATHKEEMPDTFKMWEEDNAGKEASEDTRYSALWNKTLLLLIAMLLVLFIGTWYMKRFGPLKVARSTSSEARIQLLEKRVISPKAVIYLLSIDGQKIAISETSSGIQVLQELSRTPKPFSLDLPQTKE